MKFFVSFVNNDHPLGIDRNYYLDKTLKSFDNQTVDFSGMMQALRFIRDEIDTLEQKGRQISANVTYYIGDSQKHVIKISSNYYDGFLIFKRID